MTTGRRFVAALWCVPIALCLSILPCKIEMSGSTLELASQSALAKNGGNGNGKGGGEGKGGGDGNRGGEGSGKGSGNSNSKSDKGNSGGVSAKATSVEDGTSALGVRHVDGMSEVIRDGRYIMKDAKGRTIVNRRATSADEKRLHSLIH
ncbi:hypothetical protein JNB71_20955 [Rhizobium herbae]|uniref:Glycine-rich cell wall protein n=1 Tax=Rhizobium herbae TaxID=508661 RepID=A0ABS7HFA3_9HYPH|nr:hypothetical protein [Rhizobium herbae]MBW9065778.1 hypothetical protein [Rhizobium herbae]